MRKSGWKCFKESADPARPVFDARFEHAGSLPPAGAVADGSGVFAPTYSLLGWICRIKQKHHFIG